MFGIWELFYIMIACLLYTFHCSYTVHWHVARTVLLSREAVYFSLYIYIRFCLMVSYNSLLSGTYTQSLL